VKDSVAGRRYVAEDSLIGDVRAQSIRIHIESLQNATPVDLNGECGQGVAGTFRSDEVEVQFVDARPERDVVGEISGSPLLEEKRVAGPGN
jgi:hypothetical protein